MIEETGQLHMTEAEQARVRQGEEVVVEEDSRPVVIRTPAGAGRSIDECIAIARAYEAKLGFAPVPDDGFAADVEAAIEAHREPLDTSAWE